MVQSKMLCLLTCVDNKDLFSEHRAATNLLGPYPFFVVVTFALIYYLTSLMMNGFLHLFELFSRAVFERRGFIFFWGLFSCGCLFGDCFSYDVRIAFLWNL